MKRKETGCHGRKERGSVVKCDGSSAASPRCKPSGRTQKGATKALYNTPWQFLKVRKPAV